MSNLNLLKRSVALFATSLLLNFTEVEAKSTISLSKVRVKNDPTTRTVGNKRRTLRGAPMLQKPKLQHTHAEAVTTVGGSGLLLDQAHSDVAMAYASALALGSSSSSLNAANAQGLTAVDSAQAQVALAAICLKPLLASWLRLGKSLSKLGAVVQSREMKEHHSSTDLPKQDEVEDLVKGDRRALQLMQDRALNARQNLLRYRGGALSIPIVSALAASYGRCLLTYPLATKVATGGCLAAFSEVPARLAAQGWQGESPHTYVQLNELVMSPPF